MSKTYQFKTQCKGEIRSSKIADVILPGLMTECSKGVHLYSVLSPGKMIFAVLEL